MTVELTFYIAQTPQSVTVEIDEKGELAAFRPALFELPEAAQRLSVGPFFDQIAPVLSTWPDRLRAALALLRHPKIARSEHWPAELEPLRLAALELFFDEKGAAKRLEKGQPKPSDFFLEELEAAGFFDEKSPVFAAFPLLEVMQAIVGTGGREDFGFQFLKENAAQNTLVWSALALAEVGRMGIEAEVVGHRAGPRAIAFLAEKAQTLPDDRRLEGHAKALAAAENWPARAETLAELFEKNERLRAENWPFFIALDLPALDGPLLKSFFEANFSMQNDWLAAARQAVRPDFLLIIYRNRKSLEKPVADLAAHQIAYFGPHEALETELLAALEEATLDKWNIFSALAATGGERAHPQFAKWLKMTGPNVQNEAFFAALQQQKPPGLARKLLNKFNVSGGWGLEEVAQTLGALPDGGECVGFLKNLAARGDRRKSSAALSALQNLDPVAAQQAATDWVDGPYLAQGQVDFAILAQPADPDAAVETLQKALFQPEKRSFAMRALVEIETESARDALFDAAEKLENLTVGERQFFWIALGRSGDKRAAEPLAAILKTGLGAWPLTLAAGALGRAGGEKAGPRLAAFLEKKRRGGADSDVLFAVFEALAEAGDADATADLFQRTEKLRRLTRGENHSPALALMLAGGRRCERLLKAFLNDGGGLIDEPTSLGLLARNDPDWAFFRAKTLEKNPFFPQDDWPMVDPAVVDLAPLARSLAAFLPSVRRETLALIGQKNGPLALVLAEKMGQTAPVFWLGPGFEKPLFLPRTDWTSGRIFNLDNLADDLRRWHVGERRWGIAARVGRLRSNFTQNLGTF